MTSWLSIDLLRSKAQALARALEVGAIAIDDVVAWADAVIERENHPHWSICELSLCRRRPPSEVVSLLGDVPGTVFPQLAEAALAQVLLDSLDNDSSRADRIARALYDLALDCQIDDPDLLSLAWWAWDALDLADSGVATETRPEVVAKMRETLVATLERAHCCAPG